MTEKALVYVAISPELYGEIQFGEHMKALEEAARVERWLGPGSPPQAVVDEAARRAEVLVTGWGTPSLIQTLRDWQPQTFKLRLVAHTAGSLRSLLPPEALARGLTVTHANDSLAEAVAEFTMGAMLAMRRQMILSAERYRAGEAKLPFTSMHELPGSVVGIIGASAIGRRVMELLKPWGAHILLYDPYCSRATAAALSAQLVDLETLMRESDIVSLHAPVTEETLGMLGEGHFAMMKEGALFINTARGRLIDQAGLLKALQSKRIWALLDVTDPTEPLPKDSGLWGLENCVILPHIAGHSVEARARQGQYMAEDIVRFLRGEGLRFQVAPERWDIMA